MSKQNNILSAIKAIDIKMSKLQYRKQQLQAQLRELDQKNPSTGFSFARRAVKSAPSVPQKFDSAVRKDLDFETEVINLMRKVFTDNEEWSVSELPASLRAQWTEEQISVAKAVTERHNLTRGPGGSLDFKLSR